MKIYTCLIVLCITVAGSCYAALGEPFLFGGTRNARIEVNNRILAQVNGKPLTLFDVMKKMDVLFLKQFPEYADSIAARFQFYQVNWKHVLQEFIDKELILADAEENKLPCSNGDVRQEMETLFGPNIIASLDQVGLTYDEAFKIIQGDIILRRMLYVRVHAKSMRQITPQTIKAAYERYSQENALPEQWRYQVLTVRGKDTYASMDVAKSIHTTVNSGVDIAQAYTKAKENNPELTINLTDEVTQQPNEVSETYREVLKTLASKALSAPVLQKSRDNNSVCRIFYMKEILPGGVESFSDLENKLKGALTDIAVQKETEAYLQKLRIHFDVQEYYKEGQLPEEYEPFSMVS